MFCNWRALICSLIALVTVAGCSSLKPAPVVKGKWGFINKKGTFIFKPQFDEASEFTEKGAIVRQDKRLMRLQANPPGESNAPVGPDDKPVLDPLPTIECAQAGGVKKFKIMDGDKVFFDPASKDEPPKILADGGFVCAKFDTQYAYIDKTGGLGIPRWFPEAKPFVDGRAAVKENGHWGYINKKGIFVVPPKFLDAGTFFDGLAPVKVLDDTPPT